ncbi:hypothetical protein GCK72_004582 [Caenorhabditis remanei]|uniref:F-box domain-containing protein n=1 Tax=Caenorhabditis remanei TaxID=31234 RepID=A0A6A5HE20_CAERE|nr:hypothetical protein GCK72_004582 [Caenorhabditis remanei]KAF1764633.1 hypothetical protein GCK72_004582 [Caenorhabditis remanei]
MSTAFPLLRLPDNAQRKVLNGFDSVQLINFSLLSNNAKQLAKSLNLTIDSINLYADDDFIEINTYVNYEQSLGLAFYPPEPSTGIQSVRGTVPIYVPRRVKAEKNFEDIMEFENPGMSISEWLKLLKEVFNHPPVLDISWTEPDCLFDMKSLKDTVNGFSVGEHTFTEQCSIECAQLALKNMPESKTVLFEGPAFGNPVDYQDMLIQNVKRLVIGSCDDLHSFDLKISLDDILLINSEWIEIISRHVTDKMINRFLKHWIKGSNPRMEHMRIRMINLGVCSAEGGVDIRRKDGTEGTITFINRNGNSSIVFYVSN